MADGKRAILRMNRKCAKAMGLTKDAARLFNPLRHDADAMALVKRFHLVVTPIHYPGQGILWTVCRYNGDWRGEDTTLNLAVVRCVNSSSDSRVKDV